MRILEEDAPADEKFWYVDTPENGILTVRLWNDCLSYHSSVAIERQGNQVSKIWVNGVEYGPRKEH